MKKVKEVLYLWLVFWWKSFVSSWVSNRRLRFPLAVVLLPVSRWHHCVSVADCVQFSVYLCPCVLTSSENQGGGGLDLHPRLQQDLHHQQRKQNQEAWLVVLFRLTANTKHPRHKHVSVQSCLRSAEIYMLAHSDGVCDLKDFRFKCPETWRCPRDLFPVVFTHREWPSVDDLWGFPVHPEKPGRRSAQTGSQRSLQGL